MKEMRVGLVGLLFIVAVGIFCVVYGIGQGEALIILLGAFLTSVGGTCLIMVIHEMRKKNAR